MVVIRCQTRMFAFLIVIVLVVVVFRLPDLVGDPRFGHEQQWWNDVKEPSLDPFWHVMRIGMTPVNVQRDDGDKDRGIDQDECKEQIGAE